MYQGPKFSLENLIVGGEYKSYGTNWMCFFVPGFDLFFMHMFNFSIISDG